MNWLFLVVIVLIFAFGFVILYGAPYLPTHSKTTTEALDLLNLKPGQKLLELGSGDGRILREAAKRGIYSVGYELNPLLVAWSRCINYKYRKFITVTWGNYWQHKLQPSDGIYVFLLEKYMSKLNKKIEQETTQNVKLVSYAFTIKDRQPTKAKNGLFLYEYNHSVKR